MPRRLQGTLLTCPIGYCPIGVQGMVLGIAVDLSALPYLLRLFPGPHRAGVPGRLIPVGSDCASWRRAVSRGSVHPRSETWVRVGARRRAFGQALRSEKRVGVRSERCSSSVRPSGRRGGLVSEASIVPPWPGLPVGDWTILLACHQVFGLAQELHVVHNVVRLAEHLLGSRSVRDPRFMNLI